MIDLPAIGIVIGSAIVDSINPGSIGVMILLISVALGRGTSAKRLAILGLVYIAAVFVTYLLAGMGLIYLYSGVSAVWTEYITLIVGILIMLAGIIEIKDFFWYGRWFSLKIPTKYAKKIRNYSQEKITLAGVALLGSFVSALEFPSTGAPYVAVITMLRAGFDLSTFLLILLYNLLFVLPLVVILLAVIGGVKVTSIAKWKEDTKATMRLFIGLMLVILSWILILIANGTINFG